MVGVMAVLESSSSVGHGCPNTSTLCTLLKLERGFSAPVSGATGSGGGVCYPWQDRSRGGCAMSLLLEVGPHNYSMSLQMVLTMS